MKTVHARRKLAPWLAQTPYSKARQHHHAVTAGLLLAALCQIPLGMHCTAAVCRHLSACRTFQNRLREIRDYHRRFPSADVTAGRRPYTRLPCCPVPCTCTAGTAWGAAPWKPAGSGLTFRAGDLEETPAARAEPRVEFTGEEAGGR